MTKMGMDVEAVESVGRQLKQSAASVESLVGGIDKTVSGLTGLWDGPDAQRFVQQSWPTLRKALVAAQSSVEGLGQSALNNASEQRGASRATGSGGAAGPSPSLPSSPHADIPAAPVATPSGAVLGVWTNGVLGKAIDMDGRYGAQCVDLINNYANKVFPGVPWSKSLGGPDYARDSFATANSAYFDKLPVGNAPMAGDIVCIGGDRGNQGYGHVAIVESVGANGQLTVIEQNGFKPTQGAYRDVLSAQDTGAIQGYLRAKSS